MPTEKNPHDPAGNVDPAELVRRECRAGREDLLARQRQQDGRLDAVEAETGKLATRVAKVEAGSEALASRVDGVVETHEATVRSLARTAGTPALRAHEAAKDAQRRAGELEAAQRRARDEGAHALTEGLHALGRHVDEQVGGLRRDVAALAERIDQLDARIVARAREQSIIREDREAREVAASDEQRARDAALAEAAAAARVAADKAAQLLAAQGRERYLWRALFLLIVILGSALGVDPSKMHLPLP